MRLEGAKYLAAASHSLSTFRATREQPRTT
jgi:hypothetical protein